MINFPISDVETYWWLPILVGFGVSVLTSMGGVSGAFLLLPFQVSVLRFETPAVSGTNLIFNIVAIPSGVWRYHREGRMIWPMAWTLALASLPGMFLGAVARVLLLPDVRSFKFFAALVLLYIGGRLALDIARRAGSSKVGETRVLARPWNVRRIEFEFGGTTYAVALWKIVLLSLLVGVVGGAYGVGGGSLVAPILVAVFGIPVHCVAGACLFATLMSSIGGVLCYAALSAATGEQMPDWFLGVLLGVGGMMGIYTGARVQRFVPARAIKAILAAAVFFVVVKYALDFFA